MFQPHYRPDRRLPGMGLGFFLAEAGSHRLVLHDGILPGFNSELLVAPDDGVGVIGLTNGSSGAFAWLSIELGRLLGDVLGLPEAAPRRDVPHHPEVWAELCGRYVFPPQISDLRQQLMIGFGADVLVRGGRLTVRLLTPVPALYRGLPLVPDDLPTRMCSGSICRRTAWHRFGSCSDRSWTAARPGSTQISGVSRGR